MSPYPYAFKNDPHDFSWVTKELFDNELTEILSGMDATETLSIAGIYEILSERFNNEVLERLRRHREEAEYNDGEG